MAGLKVITAITSEPVTLAEARLQCKPDSDDTSWDAVITALITTAREQAEHDTGRSFAAQTLELALDCFPDYENDAINLPMPPVASITSIKYTDTAGTEQTISASAYALSQYGESRRVAPTYGNYWPVTQNIPDAVRIRYVCGYGASGQVAGYTALPKAAKAALLLHIEAEYPNGGLTPTEREDKLRARDSLLSTIKVYGG
jgi:uncharacterized phiE125 gp8 family phage protein